MSLNILSAIYLSLSLSLILSFDGPWSVLGQTDLQAYQEIKNCNQEALYYAANVLQNHCRYVSTPECYQDFANCIDDKGYDSKKAVKVCADELGTTEEEAIMAACDTKSASYLTALHAMCCYKTELVAQKNKKLSEFEDDSQGCYNKSCDVTSCST